jgi:multidrug efflux pump
VSASLLAGYENDIYFQVGMLTTMGLSAKNAILIVEFALARFQQGKTLADAALEALACACAPS